MSKREIKFRAWHTSYQELADVAKIDFNDFGGYGTLWNEYGEEWGLEWCELMQYTGLKDKNGQEIYENDIVRNYWKNSSGDDIGHLWRVKFGKHMTSSDYYASPAYGWYADRGYEEHSLHNLPNSDGIEFIGNIWANPELLEQ